jgi:hypothetical protein
MTRSSALPEDHAQGQTNIGCLTRSSNEEQWQLNRKKSRDEEWVDIGRSSNGQRHVRILHHSAGVLDGPGSIKERKAAVGVWCVQDSPTANGKRLIIHDERHHPRRALGCSRKVRQHWLPYVPAHLPFLARRHRGAHGSAAESYAAGPNLDHDERVWQRADGSEAGSQRSCR